MTQNRVSSGADLHCAGIRMYLKSRTIMNAFYTTITITLVASIVATLLGTLAAIGIHSMKRRQKALMLELPISRF